MWTEYRVHSRLKTASPAVQSENLQNHHDVLKCKYSRLCTKSVSQTVKRSVWRLKLEQSSFTIRWDEVPTL